MHTDQGLAASYDSKQREGTQKQTNQRKGRKGRSKSRVSGGLTYSHLFSQRIGEERERESTRGDFFGALKPAAEQAVRSLQHAPHQEDLTSTDRHQLPAIFAVRIKGQPKPQLAFTISTIHMKKAPRHSTHSLTKHTTGAAQKLTAAHRHRHRHRKQPRRDASPTRSSSSSSSKVHTFMHNFFAADSSMSFAQFFSKNSRMLLLLLPPIALAFQAEYVPAGSVCEQHNTKRKEKHKTGDGMRRGGMGWDGEGKFGLHKRVGCLLPHHWMPGSKEGSRYLDFCISINYSVVMCC